MSRINLISQLHTHTEVTAFLIWQVRTSEAAEAEAEAEAEEATDEAEDGAACILAHPFFRSLELSSGAPLWELITDD